MRRPLLTAALILVALTVVSASLAQSGELALPWSTIDGGGAVASTTGDFTLSGTIGQSDAGSSRGGIYTLHGGFWGTAGVPEEWSSEICLPLVLK